MCAHEDAHVCWRMKMPIFVCLCLSSFLSPMHKGVTEGVRSIAVIELAECQQDRCDGKCQKDKEDRHEAMMG